MGNKCREIKKVDKSHDSINLSKKIDEATNRRKRKATANLDQHEKLVLVVEEKLKKN